MNWKNVNSLEMEVVRNIEQKAFFTAPFIATSPFLQKFSTFFPGLVKSDTNSETINRQRFED